MKKHFLGKLFCLIMAIAMVVGIVGCNNNNNTDPAGTTYTVTFDVQGHGTAPKTQTVDKDGSDDSISL